jgi:hypothetical protein
MYNGLNVANKVTIISWVHLNYFSSFFLVEFLIFWLIILILLLISIIIYKATFNIVDAFIYYCIFSSVNVQ